MDEQNEGQMRSENGQRFSRLKPKHASANDYRNRLEIEEVEKEEVDTHYIHDFRN